MENTYVVDIQFQITISAESDESAEAGARDLIADIFSRDQGYIPEVSAESVGHI